MRLTKTTQNGLKGMTFVFGYSVLGLFMYPKQRTKTSMTNGNKNLCVENRGICHILANNSSHFEKSNSLELKLYRCRSLRKCRLGRIKQVAILVSPIVNSWRSESSNLTLVVLDKL